MARPQKKGIDYFSFDVGFFEDRKLKELKGKFGSDGIVVYLYLLCLIYKENGYYIQLDDGFEYVASSDLNMDSAKIGQIINFLCKRSLFNDKLFTSDKVLTSRGIQLRFQEAVKSRASKTEIEVNKFWILNENETQDYIKCTHFDSYSEKNPDYSEKNPSFSIEKPHKVKESKTKESKRESTCAYACAPTLKKVEDFCKSEKLNINAEKFFYYYCAKNWAGIKDWKAKAREWAVTEKVEETASYAAYDLDLAEEMIRNRQY